MEKKSFSLNDYKTKNLQQEVIKKDVTIYYLKNKKLNWKERISGKIIHIENENK
jgi:hypothetical protein